MNLVGHNALVTGASRGLGAAIAAELLKQGSNVLLVARDQAALEKRVDEFSGLAQPGQHVASIACDLGEQEQITDAIGRAKESFGSLSILVNAAGQLGPAGQLDDCDAAAWDRTIRVNLLGTVAMCRAVLPLLRARGQGRIVNLSGGGATSPLPGLGAYAASKAAIVRFTETLAAELAGTGITVNAVAPGIAATAMTEAMLAAGPERLGEWQIERLAAELPRTENNMADAVALVAWLCSEQAGSVSGRLISARWDNWRSLGRHAAQIAGSDVYTLRRIVPGDRGLDLD